MNACDFALRYEQMRRSVIEPTTTAGNFGLVSLMRGGLAAWMLHASVGSSQPVCTQLRDNEPSPAALDGASAFRNDVALVLVSMVMTNHEERCA